MYVICTYDVNEKKCIKIMKLLRKYLFHVQNSVFEGELTPAKMKQLKEAINKIIDENDQVIFYYTYENKKLKKDGMGKEIKNLNIII